MILRSDHSEGNRFIIRQAFEPFVVSNSTMKVPPAYLSKTKNPTQLGANDHMRNCLFQLDSAITIPGTAVS